MRVLLLRDGPSFAHLFHIRPWELAELSANEVIAFRRYAAALAKQRG